MDLYRIKCHCSQLNEITPSIFFISLAVSLKPLEDRLGFSHKLGKAESVAPARISCCPLHRVHDCLVIRESDLVENEDGQQGKEGEVLQQLSCTTRAWREPPKYFPHGKGLSRSLESWGAWTQN